MRDTSDDAQAVQIDAFRRMSPAERVALAFEASEWLMSVARARTAPLSAAGASGTSDRDEGKSGTGWPKHP
jgi:hypothetical protein